MKDLEIARGAVLSMWAHCDARGPSRREAEGSETHEPRRRQQRSKRARRLE